MINTSSFRCCTIHVRYLFRDMSACLACRAIHECKYKLCALGKASYSTSLHCKTIYHAVIVLTRCWCENERCLQISLSGAIWRGHSQTVNKLRDTVMNKLDKMWQHHLLGETDKCFEMAAININNAAYTAQQFRKISKHIHKVQSIVNN